MPTLDAKAAAETIRNDVDHDYAQKIDAGERHIHTFLVDVAKFLGMDPNEYNISHISAVLAKHGIEPHIPNEYPKMLVDNDGQPVEQIHPRTKQPIKGTYVVFENADQEAAYHAPKVEAAPEPAPAPMPAPAAAPKTGVARTGI